MLVLDFHIYLRREPASSLPAGELFPSPLPVLLPALGSQSLCALRCPHTPCPWALLTPFPEAPWLATKDTHGYRHLSYLPHWKGERGLLPCKANPMQQGLSHPGSFPTWDAPPWCRPKSKLVLRYGFSHNDLTPPLRWEVESCSSLGTGWMHQGVFSVHGHQHQPGHKPRMR